MKNSAGFLQSKIAERIDTRYTPKLTFVADEGVKKSLAVAQILDQIALEKQQEESMSEKPVDAESIDQDLPDMETAQVEEK